MHHINDNITPDEAEHRVTRNHLTQIEIDVKWILRKIDKQTLNEPNKKRYKIPQERASREVVSRLESLRWKVVEAGKEQDRINKRYGDVYRVVPIYEVILAD